MKKDVVKKDLDRIATADDDGVRLDALLGTWLGTTRSAAAVRIRDGLALVDGRRTPKSHRVREGEHITVFAPEHSVVPAPAPPPIRFEDEHLLVVAKPAGMVVHTGTGVKGGTLVDALAAAGYELAGGEPGRPGIVHRLDRGTSGLLVVAKTVDAMASLRGALAAREISRQYVALVEGSVEHVRGRVEAPIARDTRRRTRFTVDSSGRHAVTRWHVRMQGTVTNPADGPAAVTLVDCQLETGRTHQIRVHMAYLGHRVVGDLAYGARLAIGEYLGLARPYLHACELGFDHPVTGKKVSIVEPLPEDLTRASERVEWEFAGGLRSMPPVSTSQPK